jgi:hypothetical protein
MSLVLALMFACLQPLLHTLFVPTLKLTLHTYVIFPESSSI